MHDSNRIIIYTPYVILHHHGVSSSHNPRRRERWWGEAVWDHGSFSGGSWMIHKRSSWFNPVKTLNWMMEMLSCAVGRFFFSHQSLELCSSTLLVWTLLHFSGVPVLHLTDLCSFETQILCYLCIAWDQPELPPAPKKIFSCRACNYFGTPRIWAPSHSKWNAEADSLKNKNT